MKRSFVLIGASLALCRSALGTDAFYINNIFQTTSPSIDATNFVNNNVFQAFGVGLYDFSNVENFTNRNQISANAIHFDTAPNTIGVRHPAKNFVNANNVSTNFNSARVSAGPLLLVEATNIINRGTLSVGEGGLLKLSGKNVDVGRSVFIAGDENVLPTSFVDTYWGFDTNQFDPVLMYKGSAPLTPVHQVSGISGFLPGGTGVLLGTNGLVQQGITLMHGTNGLTNSFVSLTAVTNQTVQIIFVRNPNSNITTRLLYSGNTAFNLGTPYVEWSMRTTNIFGQVRTNFLTLSDTYSTITSNVFFTNFANGTFIRVGGQGGNGDAAATTPRITPASFTTYGPRNFSLVSSAFPVVPPLAVGGAAWPAGGQPPSFWSTNPVPPPIVLSNRASAWGVEVMNTTRNPDTTPGSPGRSVMEIIRSMPGRIEITSDGVLDLTLARVRGVNYVLFGGTNHFVGSSNAIVSAPFMDVDLGSTNGTLIISNLLQPSLRRFSGTIETYSAVWTNSLLFQTTNAVPVPYSILFVDSQLTIDSFVNVMDMKLRSHLGTNGGSVTIADGFNVIGHFTIDASKLTLTTNAVLNMGGVDLNDMDWAGNVPYLQSFTNRGAIAGPNSLFFLGRALGPDGADLPYQNFVNAGSISGDGIIVNADYFENTGTMFGFNGSTFIQAGTANLASPGTLSTANGDINITCTNLNITNQFLHPGRALSLSIYGALNAGTNFWSVSDGFNLFVKPVTGDLSAVTVTNTAAPFENPINWWAGEDRGPGVAGYTDNAALGRLVLDGGLNSAFTFVGVGPSSNALYVDVLVIRGGVTNLDSNTNLANIFVQPGMKIYYSKAFLGNTDISTLLNGKNDGAFTQVAHAGIISTLSAPSDGGGSGTPFSGSLNVDLGVTLSSSTASISWNTVAGANNFVFFKNGLGDAAWQPLTNFVSSANGRVAINDSVGSSGRFYKVRVDLP